MATYAIGDVQGCFDELIELLNKIKFDQARDYLWFAGDLVNRGPKSLEVLRFVKGLGDRAITVLGNHDLHLLAVVQGRREPIAKDRMEAILSAPDRDELCAWLRQQPLMHRDEQLGYVMLHAGLLPQWSLDDAISHAAEVERVLRSDGYTEFINHMYGNKPRQWSDRLSRWERLRFITNCFTRLRFCDEQGRLELKEKGAPGSQPAGYQPWFDLRANQRDQQQILFGHWSTLGMRQPGNVHGLDTGCVWGGTLSALRIDVEPQWTNVSCSMICNPAG
ncbi:MAG: symmetrical bis(5'-nucleosyl)-tetraphosphatase [Thiotrichaceae bacterium]|nr:symmetrical bis(5'-nucleosyl)-tetraphosphatase [Thiotrichaceae bacterium]PCI12496.1 MAG: diadenosine tetraphosphatase [Thiotrichales bacterium]